jgi:translation initiation factor 2 alpha subunit (eIF-2alpha)
VQAVVIGVDAANFTVNLSVRRCEQVQNRKVVAQYLKQAPRPTVGQLLQNSFEEEECAVDETAEADAAPQSTAAEDRAAGAAAESTEEEKQK